MENKPVGQTDVESRPSKRTHRKLIIGLLIFVIILAGIAAWFVIISKHTDSKDTTEKVLTIDDLNNAAIQLNAETPEASVDNLTNQLKAKIDKQIANKENPIDTVMEMTNVLCSTTSASRPLQCVDYIKDFLNTKMDALKLSSRRYGLPDELQITYWRAQLYIDLYSNYELIRSERFTGSDGQIIDVAKEELKYIDLYLAIAQNHINWGEPQTSSDGRTWYFYEYQDINGLVELRDSLAASIGEKGVAR